MAIWNILLRFGKCYDHLVHFVFIWYILCSFGTFFTVLVCLDQRKIWQPCPDRSKHFCVSAKIYLVRRWNVIAVDLSLDNNFEMCFDALADFKHRQSPFDLKLARKSFSTWRWNVVWKFFEALRPSVRLCKLRTAEPSASAGLLQLLNSPTRDRCYHSKNIGRRQTFSTKIGKEPLKIMIITSSPGAFNKIWTLKYYKRT
jgi:hypothetical protein